MIHIRSTLAALLVIGSAAVASAQQATPRQQRAPGQQGAGVGRQGPGGRGAGGLFRGITLSDAEKANIKNVNAKYAPQMKALREQFKPEHQALRDARQRGDTAALKALWDKSSAERQQTKQLMDAQRVDLRAALTPANQATFDKNVAAMEKRFAKNGGKGRKPGAHRLGLRGSGV
jgi:Spy/CpxP family protein refolding chaperone